MMPQTIKQEPTREIASARKTISEQERQLTTTAFSHFKEKNYESCLQQLQRLCELRPYDARVTANKAAVEYYISHLSKTDEFSKQISAAKKQLEFGMVNTGDELDDIDRSFLLYNQAVIHFHLKQYKAAINILERLFKIIEPLGDVLAVKVCILLVEVYLLSYQLEQAYGMISYIESMLLTPKPHIVGEKEMETQHKWVVDSCKAKLHIFKARLYLTKRSYKVCGQELDVVCKTKDALPESWFLRAQLSCLQCEFQQSLKHLNNASKTANHLETGHPLPLMFYNNLSCIQFYMGKYNLAVLYARKALGENVVVMKSLPPMDKNNPQSGRPVYTLAINRRADIVYNMGVSLLFASKPRAAFEYLMEAQTVYQCNPRFWLRLAECCVAVFQQTRNDLDSSSGKKSPHVRGVIGSGSHRKIVLSAFHHHISQARSEGQSAAMPVPTLEFANLCLTNATLLLPSESELQTNMTAILEHEKVTPNDDQNEGTKRRFTDKLFIDAPPGEPMQTKEIYNLKGSILACHAYVALGFGDYYKSLEYSRALLRMISISSPYKFLGRLYFIESLVKLDRISEAIQESSPDTLKQLQKFDDEVVGLKTLKPFPKDFNEARSIMMLNLASAYCLRSEYEHCKQVLRQINASELSPSIRSHAILISVYCDLKIGNVGSALNLIKRSEVFPPGRPADRGEIMLGINAPSHLPQIPQISQLFPQQPSMNDFLNRRAVQAPVGFHAVGDGGNFPSVGGIPFPPPGNSTQQKFPTTNSRFSQNFPGLPSSQSAPAPGLPIGTFQRSATQRPT